MNYFHEKENDAMQISQVYSLQALFWNFKKWKDYLQI